MALLLTLPASGILRNVKDSPSPHPIPFFCTAKDSPEVFPTMAPRCSAPPSLPPDPAGNGRIRGARVGSPPSQLPVAPLASWFSSPAKIPSATVSNDLQPPTRLCLASASSRRPPAFASAQLPRVQPAVAHPPTGTKNREAPAQEELDSTEVLSSQDYASSIPSDDQPEIQRQAKTGKGTKEIGAQS